MARNWLIEVGSDTSMILHGTDLVRLCERSVGNQVICEPYDAEIA